MDKTKLKKSIFFDFLNRYSQIDFDNLITTAKEDVDFINWHDFCVPMVYGDEKSEYLAVRNACGLFDASPVKKYKITGMDAGLFLDAILTRKMSDSKPMRVLYATLCNEDGMLLDDGLLYKFADDNYLLMISEIDHEDHFAKVSGNFSNLFIKEVTPSLAGLAVQGPKSCSVLKAMGIDSTIEDLIPFEIKSFTMDQNEITIARAGFTADLGYELWFDPQLKSIIEQAICKAETHLGLRISGYGVSALNTLRLEGGFIVPGWETAQIFENNEDERTPDELGIAWTVDLNRKDEFIGKQALLAQKEKGPRFKTIGLTIDTLLTIEDGTPLYALIENQEKKVGMLPSIGRSYELNYSLSLASVKADIAIENSGFYIKANKEKLACKMVKLPFVNFSRYRQTPPSE